MNSLNSFSLTTELPDSIAAGLSRILLSPDLASTCLQQLVIRFSKAASAQGLQTCANQVFKHLQVFRPFAFRFALSFPRNFCTRKFKSAGVSLPKPFIRHFCSTDVHGATPIFLSCPLLFALSVFRSSLFSGFLGCYSGLLTPSPAAYCAELPRCRAAARLHDLPTNHHSQHSSIILPAP